MIEPDHLSILSATTDFLADLLLMRTVLRSDFPSPPPKQITFFVRKKKITAI